MTMNGPSVRPVAVAELSVDVGATATYAHLFDALSDPTRLTIVQHLTLGGHRVGELVNHLGLAQSTVSAHVAFLKECGLVSAQPDGRSTIYELTDPESLAQLFGVAGQILAASGQHVSLCAHVHPTKASAPAADRV